MTTTQRSAARNRAIELAIVPRAPRIPSDLLALDSMSPMQHTFAHFGSLNVRMTDHISDMIAETLASNGQR
jgi:hypothetical protein